MLLRKKTRRGPGGARLQGDRALVGLLVESNDADGDNVAIMIVMVAIMSNNNDHGWWYVTTDVSVWSRWQCDEDNNQIRFIMVSQNGEKKQKNSTVI